MRHTFTDPWVVARMWALQEQDSARLPKNKMYFEGDTVYSYGGHFPIARHTGVVNSRGEKIIFFTVGKYSSTTAKHTREVRNATHRLSAVYVFDVDIVCATSKTEHKDNVNGMRDRYHAAALKASRMLLANRERAYEEAAALRAEANEYASIFKVRGRVRPANVRLLRVEELKKRRDRQGGLFANDDRR